MLPAEPRLEVRFRLPDGPTRKPALLFVHGGYSDAWCWEPNFLPWFAAQGHPAYALSLRGHGESGGGETLWLAGIDDYAADVESVASRIGGAPILVGHSMGAAIVERILARRPVPGAALLAPIPPTGVLGTATRLATEHPDYLFHMLQLDPVRVSAEVLHALQPFYFSRAIPHALLAEATRHISAESPRALLDLSLRLHWITPPPGDRPVFVLGSEGDRICTPDEVRATAAHHGVEATILPGLAHMLMLEPGWEAVAVALLGWIDALAQRRPRRGAAAAARG